MLSREHTAPRSDGWERRGRMWKKQLHEYARVGFVWIFIVWQNRKGKWNKNAQFCPYLAAWGISAWCRVQLDHVSIVIIWYSEWLKLLSYNLANELSCFRVGWLTLHIDDYSFLWHCQDVMVSFGSHFNHSDTGSNMIVGHFKDDEGPDSL